MKKELTEAEVLEMFKDEYKIEETLKSKVKNLKIDAEVTMTEVICNNYDRKTLKEIIKRAFEDNKIEKWTVKFKFKNQINNKWKGWNKKKDQREQELLNIQMGF